MSENNGSQAPFEVLYAAYAAAKSQLDLERMEDYDEEESEDDEDLDELLFGEQVDEAD